ncbi:hypothetical protein OG594_33715 [Streptomyces sp. NBC_01214]|uniref:hypothetical protein n=1 Tax=Streptomyces sp. NBC_01214 TaxID=2903777 RepID=UPI00224CE022|nr:hypothetical protein [Streptomyces sp. NBC_01214]MCX4806522.1 hypothetical protein [Streptomyces sp. NBC_01214]
MSTTADPPAEDRHDGAGPAASDTDFPAQAPYQHDGPAVPGAPPTAPPGGPAEGPYPGEPPGPQGGGGARDDRQGATGVPHFDDAQPSGPRPPRAGQDEGDAAELISSDQFSFLIRQSTGNANTYGGHHNTALSLNLGGPQPVEFQQTPLDARDVQQRHRLYQRAPVPDHQPMADCLTRNHLVVLIGARGSGRDTTARVLLADACGSDRVAVLYSGGAGLAQALAEQADRHLTRGHGIVLDLGTELPAPAALEALALRAGTIGAHVVLIAENLGAELDALSPYAFRHTGPDLKKVLEAHLEHELQKHRAQGHEEGDCPQHALEAYLRDVLRDPRVEDELGAGLPVREAVSLAGTLATFLHRPPEELGQAFGAWRNRLRTMARTLIGLTAPATDAVLDPHQQPLRIAYVLCDGLPLSDFIRVGTLLCDEVQRAETREAAPERRVFDLILDQLVETGAGVAAAPDAGPPSNPRRVRLAEPELMSTVIEVVWHGPGWLRAPLLRWLQKLAEDRLERVRSRAAVIAGLLLRLDFDSVYRDLVQIWARSRSARDRQYAALALAVAVGSGDSWLTARIDRQVVDWARSPAPQLQDSAARAYGTLVGTRDVPGALEALEALGSRRTPVRYASVAYATAALFLTPDGAEPVADALGRWVRRPDNEASPLRHAVGTLIVLGPYTVGPELPSRPKLAHQAMENPEREASLLLLWRHALVDPAYSGLAWALLEQWLLAGDRDGELGLFLAGFVPRAASDELLHRAGFHVARMARRNPAAPCVRRVLRAIRRRRP